jgi:hypothetical protein
VKQRAIYETIIFKNLNSQSCQGSLILHPITRHFRKSFENSIQTG